MGEFAVCWSVVGYSVGWMVTGYFGTGAVVWVGEQVVFVFS